MREELSIPLGFTEEGVVILAVVCFSHSIRPGMLRRLARQLEKLAQIADDEPLEALMGRQDYELQVAEPEENNR